MTAEVRPLRPLSRSQAAILEVMLRLRFATTEELVLALGYPTAGDLERNIVRVHIYHLRRRLGRAGAYLKSVKGRGYRWTPPA